MSGGFFSKQKWLKNVPTSRGKKNLSGFMLTNVEMLSRTGLAVISVTPPSPPTPDMKVCS